MSRRTTTALAFALALALTLGVVGGVAAVSTERVLVVRGADTGDTLVSVPVSEGTTVALEYTHSVEQSRVYDGYAVVGTRLEQTRMEFESYGWGLPAGANVTRENGTFVYDPPGSLAVLPVKPGRIAGHRLHVGDRTFDLVARSNASAVRIRVERRSVLPVPVGATTVAETPGLPAPPTHLHP